MYYGARAAGVSTIMALILSGVPPALRVVGTVSGTDRVDVIGTLILSGIALGTVIGLLSGSPRLYLIDGLVPTVALGAACLFSLLSSRPLMFRLALETMGEDTQRGHEFAETWNVADFRKSFQIITIVWGLIFLAEAGLQALIIETQSINTAKQSSNLLPVAVLIATFAWTRLLRATHRATPAPRARRHAGRRPHSVSDGRADPFGIRLVISAPLSAPTNSVSPDPPGERALKRELMVLLDGCCVRSHQAVVRSARNAKT